MHCLNQRLKTAVIVKARTVNQRLKTAEDAVISVLQSCQPHRGRIFCSGAKKARFSAPSQAVQIVGHVSRNACSETTFKGRSHCPSPQQLCDIPASRSPGSHFSVERQAVGCEHVWRKTSSSRGGLSRRKYVRPFEAEHIFLLYVLQLPTDLTSGKFFGSCNSPAAGTCVYHVPH